MEEESLNISIFDVDGDEGAFFQQQPQPALSMDNVIAGFEALLQQDVVKATQQPSTHYLLLDPHVQLADIEAVLGQPASVVHTDPVILSIVSEPTITLPPYVHYHKTKHPLQIVPNTNLFESNLNREAQVYNTRTPQQWKAQLANRQEVQRVCAEFLASTHTVPQYITQWVDSIQ